MDEIITDREKPPDTFEGHPMADYSSIELKIESCQVCV